MEIIKILFEEFTVACCFISGISIGGSICGLLHVIKQNKIFKDDEIK